MDGYRTRILNDPLNVSSTIYYNGSAVAAENPLPCTLGDGAVTITGDVVIPGVIQVTNASNEPLLVALSPGSNAFGDVGLLHLGAPVSGSNPLPTLPIFPDEAVDAFGRQRVSEPFTLGDYKNVYGLDPSFIDRTSNGGAVAHVRERACAQLTTTTAANSLIIHQSRAYHHYMPGKSHSVLCSVNFGGAQANVVKRAGYYDDRDGVYLELNGSGVASFVIRAATAGATGATETRVSQASWNRDALDGSGLSGQTLDFTKTQLFFTDFQWLGVGRVRCGFSLDGISVVAHEFYHSNRKDRVYMVNPSLPIRAELSNVGVVSAPGGAMDQICATVMSEGGYVENGTDFAALTETRAISAGLGNTLPALCIALANTYKGSANRALVRLVSANVFALNQNVSYEIVRLPSVSAVVGGSWVSPDADSCVLYNATATSLSSTGVRISVSFAAAGATGPPGQGNFVGSSGANFGSSAKRNFIAQDIDSGNSEVYAIYVRTLTANATSVVASMQWREVY